MDFEKLLEEFKAWLDAHEIEGVTFGENLGADESITAITFPVVGEDGFFPYDIVATCEADGSVYFFVDYCDIPEVDELELYRFLNDLNRNSALTVMADDDHLCLAYSLPVEFLTSGEAFARAFVNVIDGVEELSDEIQDAFGIGYDEEDEETEDIEELEELDEVAEDELDEAAEEEAEEAAEEAEEE